MDNFAPHFRFKWLPVFSLCTTGLVATLPSCEPPVDKIELKFPRYFIPSFSRLTRQGSQQVVEIFLHAPVRLAQLLNFAARMQYGRVIPPAKRIANLRQTMIG